MQDTVVIAIAGLRPGGMLQAPILDAEQKVLLIAAGIRLTAAHLDNLAGRGITQVRVGVQDLANLSNDAAGHRAGENGGKSQVVSTREPPANTSFRVTRRRGQKAEVRKGTVAQLGSHFETGVVELRGIFQDVANGSAVNAGRVFGLAENALTDMAKDFDAYLLVGLRSESDRYPFSHALQVSRLSMAMGALLDIDERSLVELGVGCMLHDLGMLRLDPELLNRERPLDQIERLNITKHPRHTLDIIRKVPRVSHGSRMIAYQMHERLDGSGYPRGCTASHIHPLTKIAMVADTFVAMTSQRPHRPGLPPYYAMLELLELARAGQLDADAIKALLKAVSMFPIGSYVQLSDGRTARIIGSNPEDYSRPLIEVPAGGEDGDTEEVDLSVQKGLSIVRPALAPDLKLALVQ